MIVESTLCIHPAGHFFERCGIMQTDDGRILYRCLACGDKVWIRKVDEDERSAVVWWGSWAVKHVNDLDVSAIAL